MSTGPGGPSLAGKAGAILFWGLAGLCVLLGLVDLTYTKHGHYSWEELPAVQLLVGFVACVAVVGVGAIIRRFAGRDEDFYDR